MRVHLVIDNMTVELMKQSEVFCISIWNSLYKELAFKGGSIPVCYWVELPDETIPHYLVVAEYDNGSN